MCGLADFGRPVAERSRRASALRFLLCENPAGLNAAEVCDLIAARDRTGVTMGEAFMIQTHPQWLRLVELVRAGLAGPLVVRRGFRDKNQVQREGLLLDRRFTRDHFHIRGSKVNTDGSANRRLLKSECDGLMSKLNSSG